MATHPDGETAHEDASLDQDIQPDVDSTTSPPTAAAAVAAVEFGSETLHIPMARAADPAEGRDDSLDSHAEGDVRDGGPAPEEEEEEEGGAAAPLRHRGCFRLEPFPAPAQNLPLPPGPGPFILIPDPAAEFGAAPKEQAELYIEVCRTLKVIQTLQKSQYPSPVDLYYAQLTQIAAVGLTGDWARPGVASPMLAQLQRDILDMEAPIVKTGYMTWLARVAAWFVIPAFLVVALARLSASWTFLDGVPSVLSRQQIECVALLVAGAAVGVWLSFGARKPGFTFNDLLVLEEDFLGPKTRIGFTVLLTLVLALLFTTGFLAISVGQVSTEQVLSNPVVALVVGILCGFSEKSLSSQVSAQAGRIVKPDPPATKPKDDADRAHDPSGDGAGQDAVKPAP